MERLKKYASRAVVGIATLVSLIQLGIWLYPNASRQIFISGQVVSVQEQPINFSYTATLNGGPPQSGRVSEVTTTIWRPGGDPITNEMTRRPLELTAPAPEKFIAAKIISQNSSIPDNFTLRLTDNTVSLSWKVFDPDMAVKIASLVAGPSNRVTYDETNLGPGLRVGPARNYALATAFVFIVILSFLIIIVVGFYLLNMTFKFSEKVKERFGRFDFIAFMVSVILGVGVIGVVWNYSIRSLEPLFSYSEPFK